MAKERRTEEGGEKGGEKGGGGGAVKASRERGGENSHVLGQQHTLVWKRCLPQSYPHSGSGTLTVEPSKHPHRGTCLCPSRAHPSPLTLSPSSPSSPSLPSPPTPSSPPHYTAPSCTTPPLPLRHSASLRPRLSARNHPRVSTHLARLSEGSARRSSWNRRRRLW